MAVLIHRTIAEVAARRPDDVAACFLDEQLTYSQLVARASRLASALVDQGVRRRDRVGIFMDKSLNVPVSMYGIMQCGGAYVPLDPAAPVDRLASMIRDCGIRTIVSAPNKSKTLVALAEKNVPLECVIGTDTDLPWRSVGWAEVEQAPEARATEVTIIESDLAYIIYTSGSTGTPKGIMHTHYSCLSFARWAAAEYALKPSDRLGNQAPLHFDVSILDYFSAAVAGAATVIIPQDYVKLAASYSQLLSDQSVSVLYTVPFALIQLLERGMLPERNLSALRLIIFCGEPFPIKHLQALMTALPQVEFDNLYGPAEVNGCSHYTVPPRREILEAVPIGPIAQIAEALVVDAADAPVPRGEIGELLVRTPTMMQGYWGRPELNAKAFYRRSVECGPDDVFYRTGDLVRCDDTSVLHFIGRKDRQIKVRGYRVELDEIEAALTAIDGVEETAVFPVPDEAGSQKIQAVVLLRSDSKTTEPEILARLKRVLPWYAVPAGLRCRRELPRTTTGKIDRTKLRNEAIVGEQFS